MFADKVFRGGQVITVDKQNRIVEAVAIKRNKILAVGSNDEVGQYIDSSTEVIDIQGKSLLPGFIDSHVHLAIHAYNKFMIDCSPPNISSINHLLEILKSKAEVTPSGQWIRAHGFREITVTEKRVPTREELDKVSTDHPIIVFRGCQHNSIANSKALEMAGIDKDTPNPKGGEIQRDEYGNLTGLLIENAHFYMRNKFKLSEEQLLEGLSLASNDLVAAGITSLHDAGGYGFDDFNTMKKASQSGVVKPRITAFVCSLYKPDEFIDQMIAAGIQSGLGDDKFKVGPAKVFIDGASSVPNIATRKPYSHKPNDSGILYYNQKELNYVLGKAHDNGFQITAHAMGDKAIEMVLDCIERALDKNPRTDHRHRIEHCSLSQPDLLKRMKKLGVVPSPNPSFFYDKGDLYPRYFGERIIQPIKDWLSAGLKPAAGSDMPVTNYYSPLFGIWGAVNRITQNGQIYDESQKVSVEEAISLYTWNGAYATFEEDIKGSIEVGKLADLVVINDQLLNVSEDRIKDLKVELTMIDGEVVYKT